MAVTRAQVEAILVSRLGPLLTKAGMDTTTIGSNSDLNDPIGWALRQNSYTVTDISDVTDTDLASLVTDDIDKMLDFAELRTLESILGNLALVDVKVGSRAENLSQLAKQLETRIDKLTKKLEDTYGLSVPSMETGLLTYEFAFHKEIEEE